MKQSRRYTPKQNVVLITALLLSVISASNLAISQEPNHDRNSTVAKFIYDPLSGRSVSNDGSHTGNRVEISGKQISGEGSFTIEAFARPETTLATKPRDFLPVFGSTGDTAHFEVGIYRSTPPHSYNWWMAQIVTKGERPQQLGGGRYGGIGMVRVETPWRHLAFVWNADKRTAEFYLDYRLQGTRTFTGNPGWDVSTVQVGHGDGMKPFAGIINAPRLSDRVLSAWEFQRATDVELRDISFAPEEAPSLPADYGHVDVRLHYGAVGDGRHDDTEAICRAFAENDNRVPVEYKTVYFPAGTYLISDSIRFSRFMVVRGAGRDRTKIVLRDESPGYDNSDVPKPAFAVGYDWPYVNRPKKNRAGNAIGSYIFDLTIDTGHGNPSALGLDFHCNNIGAVENVDIVSRDGAGLVGLDFKRAWPGPCLIKNVTIDGFDVGIEASHREYSLVFSDVRLRNQRRAAIQNNGNVLSLENVVSENSVPAIINRSGGLVTMINSRLTGGDPNATAIESENASVYLRNIEIAGYGNSLIEQRHDTRAKPDAKPEIVAKSQSQLIDEYSTGPFSHAFDQPEQGSLKLPIKESPRLNWPAVSEWVNVASYRNLVVDRDWSRAIQAAIDAGRPLVYFPPDEKYAIRNDIIIRGHVRSFFGATPKSRIHCGSSRDDQLKSDEEVPAFRFATDLPVFECHMLTLGRVIHDTPTTFIVRHCHVDELDAREGCGDLFIEDAGGKWRFNRHQRVWGRQLNPETKGVPEIVNDGGTLWILGMKTEYLSTKIVNRGGARTELLGGLMYPVHPVKDETLPMFINEDSDISLIHGVSVYRKNHRIYIRDAQQGDTREYTDWHWTSGRPVMNLYRSSK